MSRFYETTILVDPPTSAESGTPWGIQVLASPPEVNGERINYEPLLARLREQSALRPAEFSGERAFTAALSALADPVWNRRIEQIGQFAFSPTAQVPDRLGVGEYLLFEAPIAAETSPLAPQSLARLAGETGAITFLMIKGAPALVIVGTAVGLVVLRGLGAVGGALWRGAEPNVERFGADASAKVLDALSKRFNLDSTDDSNDDEDDDISSAS